MSIARVPAPTEAPSAARLEDLAAWPDFETWQRICKLYGWPRTFAS
jgi:hypothetical protein